MPSTFVHGLLPTSCLFVSRSKLPKLSRKETVKLALAAVVLGNMPDLDIIPAFLFPDHWLEIHRAWGHNLFSLTVWTLIGVWGLRTFVSKQFTPKIAAWLSTCLVFSHIVLDSMADYDFRGRIPGIPIFWPLSRWEFHSPFRLFKNIRLEESINPIVAHVTSGEFWHRVFFQELMAALTLLVFWTVAFHGVFFLNRLRKPSLEQPVDTQEQIPATQSGVQS